MTKGFRDVSAVRIITTFCIILTGATLWREALPRTASAETSSNSFAFVGVPTDRSPEIYKGSFLFRTTEEMLKDNQVAVYPEDKVFAFPDPKLGLGSTIQVYRAKTVLLKDGELSQHIRTWAPTVGEMLHENRVEVGEKDSTEPKLSEAITASTATLTVTITRVSESQVAVNKPIDFITQYKDDATLEKGKEVVTQVGAKGNQRLVYLVRRENRVEISRKLVDVRVTVQAVPKVITRGTKIITYGSGKASWYGGVPARTAAHRTLPMGTKVRVTNVSNGKSVVVTISDRGPFIAGRIIDLSKDSFAVIAPLGAGVTSVRVDKE